MLLLSRIWIRMRRPIPYRQPLIGQRIKIQQTSWNGVRVGLSLTSLVAIAAFVLALVYGPFLRSDVSALQRAITIEEVGPNATEITRTLYINADTGNDSNPGTDTQPLATLTEAIAELASVSADNCILQLQTTIDLGVDPVLDFFPAVRQCKNIIIRGTKGNTIGDSVASIQDSGPYNGWKSVTGTNGDYDLIYQKQFVHNENQDRYYVVDNITDNMVFPIIGDLGDYFSNNGGISAQISGPNAFKVGDEFVLYTADTQITWNNSLALEIPFNHVTFEALHMAPSPQSWVSSPNGLEHRVTFRGCRLDIAKTLPTTVSTTPTEGSFMGSYDFQGVYAIGTVDDAALTAEEQGRCVISTSLWIENARIMYTGHCYAHFYKASGTNSGSSYAQMIVRGSNFRLFGAEFSGYDGARSYLHTQQDSTISLHRVTMIDATSHIDIVINLETAVSANTRDLDITLPNQNNLFGFDQSACMYVQENAHLIFNGHLKLEGACSIFAVENPHIRVNAFSSAVMIGRTASPLIGRFGNDAIVHFFAGASITTLVDSPLIKMYERSDLTLASGMTFNSPGPNANMIEFASGSMDSPSFTNSGAGNSLVKVGANNPSTFFTQDDYKHPNSQRAQLKSVAPSEDQTVWVQASGSDTASGSETDPVATIDGAIDVLAQRSVLTKDCTIRISGTINLGLDPIICTNSINHICKHIILTGGQYGLGGVGTSPVDGTTSSVLNQGIESLLDRTTVVTTGTTYGTDTYQGHFVLNKEQNRVFIIESNTNTSLQLVTSRPEFTGGVLTPLYVPPGMDTFTPSQAWGAFDSFTLFTVQDKLTWSNVLQFDMPYNQLRIENLIIDPDYGYIQSSQTREPALIFRGVRMVTTEQSNNIGGIFGSFVLQGAYVEESPFFINSDLVSDIVTGFVQLESVWLKNVGVGCGGEMRILGLKMEGDSFKMRNCEAYGKSIEIQGGSIRATQNSRGHFVHVNIDTGSLTVSESSRFTIFYFQLLGGRIDVSGQSDFNVPIGSMSVSGGDNPALVVSGQSTARILVNVFIAAAPFNEHVFTATDGAHLHIFSTFTTLVSTSSSAYSIFNCEKGATLHIDLGNDTNSILSTPAGGALIRAGFGCTLFKEKFATNLINSGAVSTEVLKCGTNPTSDFSTSEQDLSANTFCTLN